MNGSNDQATDGQNAQDLHTWEGEGGTPAAAAPVETPAPLDATGSLASAGTDGAGTGYIGPALDQTVNPPVAPGSILEVPGLAPMIPIEAVDLLTLYRDETNPLTLHLAVITDMHPDETFCVAIFRPRGLDFVGGIRVHPTDPGCLVN